MATVFANAGKAIVSGRLIGATPSQAEPKYLAWGTGAGTSAVADTTLFTETAQEARTTCTTTQVTTTLTNDTFQAVGTITVATAAKTITNAGLFDVTTASAGNMLMKTDFTGIALNVGDSIQFTMKLQFT
jgi:hypothetical protein